jgi:hypothetical protein
VRRGWWITLPADSPLKEEEVPLRDEEVPLRDEVDGLLPLSTLLLEPVLAVFAVFAVSGFLAFAIRMS